MSRKKPSPSRLIEKGLRSAVQSGGDYIPDVLEKPLRRALDLPEISTKKRRRRSLAATSTPSEPKVEYTRRDEGSKLRVERKGLKRRTVPEAKEAQDITELREILKDPERNIPAQAADEYTQAAFGRPYSADIPEPGTSLEKQSGIARVFSEAAEGSPEYKQRLFEAYGNAMPEVVERTGAQNYDQLTEAAYRQLGDETKQQFASLPVSTSYHYGEGEYARPSAMLRDILGEGNLNVFRGGDPHEFLGEVDPDTGLSLNEMFRAVHDFYGHGTTGATFRPGGEELAYASHSQMMSPLARMALLSETRGQNSLVNYSPLNARIIAAQKRIQAEIDAERRYAERFNLPIKPGMFDEQNARLRELGAEFQYAPQTPVLLPPEYLPPDMQRGIPEYVQEIIQPRAPSGPERAVHFSQISDLEATDPAFYGSGHRGDDYALRGLKGSPKAHTSFYLGPEGTVIPEDAVFAKNPYAYETELSGLYDMASDPEGLVQLAAAHNPASTGTSDFARMVKEYGYGGYRAPFGPSWRPGEAANIFSPTLLRRRIERGRDGYAEGGLAQAA